MSAPCAVEPADIQLPFRDVCAAFTSAFRWLKAIASLHCCGHGDAAS